MQGWNSAEPSGVKNVNYGVYNIESSKKSIFFGFELEFRDVYQDWWITPFLGGSHSTSPACSGISIFLLTGSAMRTPPRPSPEADHRPGLSILVPCSFLLATFTLKRLLSPIKGGGGTQQKTNENPQSCHRPPHKMAALSPLESNQTDKI